MKRNKDWTDVMRSELRDAELTPPGDGWERLRQELTQSAGTVVPAGKAPRGSAVRLYWPRLAAAAAVVLVCIVTGELLWRADREQGKEGSVIATAAGGGNAAGEAGEVRTAEVPLRPKALMAESEVPQSLLAQAGDLQSPSSATRGNETHARSEKPVGRDADRFAGPVPDDAAPQTKILRAADGRSETLQDVSSSQHSSASGNESQQVRSSVGERTEPSEEQQPSSRSQSRQTSHSQPEYISRSTAFSDAQLAHYTPPRKKTSLAVFAAGGVTGGGTGGVTPSGMLMSDVSSSDDSQVTTLKRPDYGTQSYRHHQPLSFGLSVRKEFAHGLSLESGVNYTLLRSDVRMRYSSEDIPERLHFIGIPLRMNWQFLQRRGFSLYIGAGGMVEKCVSAELGSHTVKEKGVQWSVVGAAGAEYRFGGPVGVYFEPEASYYFTKTSLQTARTDSPLSLTLRLGVRVSFR